MSYIVALTGGIASGKSTVADRFAALGVEIIDADVVARELVKPQGAALDEIVAAFGAVALDESGRLDRRAMRERIFADPYVKRRLELILHPRVRVALRERAQASAAAYAMVVVPLLTECGGDYAWTDRVLVVDVPREIQLRRLIERDQIDTALANAMLDAQATRGQRFAIADDVIDNQDGRDALNDAVRKLHERYVGLAAYKLTLR